MKHEAPQLPSDVSSFVGRKTELAVVRERLGSSRLLTLTGPGGVGKSRLALRVAAEARRAFSDGVYLVELADVDDPSLLPEVLADALGLVQQTARAPFAQLRRHLADQHALILFDGCEHLAKPTAVLIGNLLRAAPAVRFLVTSRESLGVVGESLYAVPPMGVPNFEHAGPPVDVEAYDAVALLVARAADQAPGFKVTPDNAEAVVQLCARLDGLPLAIELAAPRLRSISIEDLLLRLDDRLRLLVGGSPEAPARQQTLRALIDWSYTLCSADEQALLSQLSVFSGGFDLVAVEDVCSSASLTGDMLDLVDLLVRKSMVTPDAAPRRVRFRLLETIREYAAERLAEDEAELTVVRGRHRDYYANMAAQAAKEWWGADQAKLLATLRIEHANLRSAFDYAAGDGHSRQVAVAMAVALQWHWIAGGYLAEGRRWLGRVLAANEGAPTAASVDALWLDAYLGLLQGDLKTARNRLDEADRLASNFGTADVAGYAAQVRGMASLFGGDLEAARIFYETALKEHEANGNDAAIAGLLFQLAVTYTFCGEATLADEACERAIRLCEQSGERWGRAYAMWALAVNRWLESDYRTAAGLARRSLEITVEFNDQLGISHLIGLLGWIAASEGDAEHGALWMGLEDALREKLGTPMSAFGPHLANCHFRSQERLRAQLGEEGYRHTTQSGARLDARDVVLSLIGRDVHGDPAGPVVAAAAVLSPRELEVARLVSEGRSNKLIAETLVLSTRTVDSHVQHIFTKLGFKSRAQVAAWMARQ
ncbi:LuxR family transcriptional regulator [Nocardioides sp. S5]|uniref:ATP-binding protein n=1 Tax=Nocardioides sp. S5 TaxID=2017486 RepID=UPI001A8F3525|nr:LuxR C-terminal-related transcriptional regulator [Nocardioides sp. S5]QSR29103.1 LuxR family transcriptional regulator [Nocardioides sp. S5]